MTPNIEVLIHAFTEPVDTARRDAEDTPITLKNIVDVSWSDSPNPPYQTAQITLAQPFDEIKNIGLGVKAANGDTIIRATGWLEIRVDGTTVFFGLVSGIQTGVQVDSKGARQSSPLRISAQSWVSILQRGFRLGGSDRLDVGSSLINTKDWGKIINSVFSVAEGGGENASFSNIPQAFNKVWEDLIIPSGAGFTLDLFLNMEIYSGDERPNAQTTVAPVVGKRISQIQVPRQGSLWQLLVQTFQPSPALIDLYPSWNDGVATIIYRMRPLNPSIDSHSPKWYEFYDQIMPKDSEREPTLNKNIRRADDYTLSKIKSISLNYDGTNRSNYIEVTTPYTGPNQLAGVAVDPVILREDILRYGLHPLEISYPFFRESEEESVRDSVNDLIEYASALYAEAHAYAKATISSMYDNAPIGEWVRFDPYNTGEMWNGYVESRTHRLSVNSQGARSVTTQLQLSRVSPVGQTSNFKITKAYSSSVSVEVGIGGDD